jgi:hypothetical protein
MAKHYAPNLWHMDSLVLQGFYQSEVLVAATNHEDAIRTAMQAYDRWLAYRLSDYGYHPLISDGYVTDEGYAEQSKAKRCEFHAEVKAKLKQVAGRGLLLVSS